MTTNINYELSAEIPEGFAPMTEDELKQVFPHLKKTIRGIICKERNIVIAVFWQKEIPILSAITDLDSAMKNLQSRTKTALKQHGYQPGEDFETEICGELAKGFRFSYDGKQRMNAEVILTKHAKTHYTLHFFATEADAGAKDIFTDVLQSFRFA